MTKDSAERQVGEARALLVILEIARYATWCLDRVGTSLTLPFANYLYCNEAQLLLVPSTASLEWQRRVADSAMREARSDALIVAADPHAGELSFAIGLWGLNRNTWLMPAWPWAGRDGLWFGSDAFDGEAIAIRAGRLQREPAPWYCEIGKYGGQVKAGVWFEQIFAGPSNLN